ncbi:uncharacterized mitochondrial protein-like protein [Tanacetum coccineum]
MRPFGCLVTILNTIDNLGKFNGKADEGFFIGYSLNSKAFRVFNSRTRIVEENFHIRFSENTPNVVGSGPDSLFDIDALTRTMNYEPIVAGTKSNGFACTKACEARKETKPIKDYILLPLWTVDRPFSQDLKSSHDDGSKPLSDDRKKVDEDPRKDSEFNVVGGKISIKLPDDLNMPALEDYSIFDFTRNDEDRDVDADMNNLDTTIQVSPIPTTRIHKDHPLDQVIGDLQLATQTRNMSKNLKEHRKASTLQFTKELDFSKELCNAFEKLMHEKFQMSSMRELTFFLGLQVQQKNDGIFISQDKYVVEILKKFRFTEVKTASTPMKTQKPLLKDKDDEEVDVHIYQVNLKVSHLHAVKIIFMYLKGQPKLGLWYPKDSPFDLVAYTDSDYAEASLDRKSTTGEVEYVAASSCCGQVLWIQNQLLDYGLRAGLPPFSNTDFFGWKVSQLVTWLVSGEIETERNLLREFEWIGRVVHLCIASLGP